VAEFVNKYRGRVGWVCGILGLPASLWQVGHSTVEDALRALVGLRIRWETLRQQRQHQ